jgi:hypothetical protein
MRTPRGKAEWASPVDDERAPHRSTIVLKPPQNIRFASKGIAFGSIIFASRELFQAVDTREHFLKCSSVVNNVPICSLNRQYSLSALPELARLVERDLDYAGESALRDAG